METISTKRFVKKFREISANEDRRFCFVLGAGASRSSGIKTGAELARAWLEELKQELEPDEYQNFLTEKKIDEAYPGHSYPAIYDECFKLDPESGFHRINSEMELATPGYGYSVLSQILSELRHNIIITTNFDTLSEEALYTYTSKRPLVCGHELLADFAKPSINRPLIIKIHRDRFLGPKSTKGDTEKISNQWIEALNNIFLSCIPVFIGYGGNDGSLMNYLLEIKQFSNIFWCEIKGSPLAQPVRELLEKHSGKLVEIDGFDELMFWLQDELNLPVLNTQIKEVAEDRSEKYWNVFNSIKNKYAASSDDEAKAAAERLIEKVDDDSWWKWQLKINDELTNEGKHKIYKAAINAISDSPQLNVNYAVFLEEKIKDYKTAEELYKKTLQAFPNETIVILNYAAFLKEVKKDYTKSEEQYKKALKLRPDSPEINGFYAIYLKDVKKDIIQAEIYLRKTIELAPFNANYKAAYGSFIAEFFRDFEKAEKLYKQALRIQPDNTLVNCFYANFLHVIRKDYIKAEKLYKNALSIESNDPTSNGAYAIFLKDVQKDYISAEEFYKRAIKLEPEDAAFNGNYGGFLLAQGKNQDAEVYIVIAEKNSEKDDIKVEVAFYRYAHFVEGRTNYLLELKKIICTGARSLHFNLQDNVDRAIQDGHPEPELLQRLADIITKDEPVGDLCDGLNNVTTAQ